MTQHKVQPTVEENASPVGGTTYRHDAYSTIRLTNPQGGSSTLFGSDIRHDNNYAIETYFSRVLEMPHRYDKEKPNAE